MSYIFDYISPRLRSIIEPATLHTHSFDKKLGCRYYNHAYVAPYFYWDKSIGCVLDEKGKSIKDSECVEWKENEVFSSVANQRFFPTLRLETIRLLELVVW